MKLIYTSPTECYDAKTGVVIIYGEPPVYERASQVFDLTGKAPVFAYDGKIYNPFRGNIDDSIIAHEMVHFEQQGTDVDGWWGKYFTDPAFRLSQEIPAYRVQFQVLKKKIGSRSVLAFHKVRMCKDLASPMYGNLIGYAEAYRIIGQ